MKTFIHGTPKAASIKKPKIKNSSNTLADAIFEEYREDNISIYKEIEEILDKDNQTLPLEITIPFKISNYCSSKILTIDSYPDNKCYDCKRLFTFTEDEIVDDYIEIQVGKYQDKFIGVYRYPLISSNYKLESEKNNIYYFNTEDSNMQIIMMYIFIKQLSVNKNFPITTDFIYAYICTGKLAVLKFEDDYFGDFKGTKDYHYFCIIKQLISTLHFLNFYNFVHGNPSIEYLSFEEKHIKYKYKHLSINSEYNLKLDVSQQSSISLFDGDNFYHFMKKGIKFNNPIKHINSYPGSKFKDNIKLGIPYYPGFKEKRVIGFKVSEPVQLPIFSGSFDCCCFLISILCEDVWRNELMKNQKFVSVWKGLWKEDEYSNLMKDIKNFDKNNNFKNIFRIVSKYYIRCDAVDYLFENLN